jgi:hypothetical protein
MAVLSEDSLLGAAAMPLLFFKICKGGSDSAINQVGVVCCGNLRKGRSHHGIEEYV